ncbi:MAG: ornithine carbamoyltransferase [Alphaproteobacteria bacterium]|nr:MAG: ornithine carbamoyltransferase [Alphaproteobacteria bacterium]
MSSILAKDRFVEPASVRHFLDLAAIDAGVLRHILDHASAMKRRRQGWPKGRRDPERPLDGRVVALIFEKSSTRTRVSFDVAVRQLGGDAMVLSAADTQLGRGETIADTARVLARYVDAIMIRANDHAHVEELAAVAGIPVINGLTNRSHPCQLMADVMTIEEQLGPIKGKTVAWLGDGNNVATSAVHAAVKFGFRLRLASPPRYRPDAAVLDWARAAGGDVAVVERAEDAVAGAHAVMTDTWVSMGDEGERAARLAAFAGYQVTPAVMAAAAPGAVFLHCLPAHRGEEMTADVIDGAQSVVWDQAENRLHAQKAILRWCLDV